MLIANCELFVQLLQQNGPPSAAQRSDPSLATHLPLLHLDGIPLIDTRPAVSLPIIVHLRSHTREEVGAGVVVVVVVVVVCAQKGPPRLAQRSEPSVAVQIPALQEDDIPLRLTAFAVKSPIFVQVRSQAGPEVEPEDPSVLPSEDPPEVPPEVGPVPHHPSATFALIQSR